VFLGLDIRRNERGHLELMQWGLIQKIIEECRLESKSKEHGMPAVTKILDKDKQGPERESEWKYRTIIGMLTYLSVSSRPDIDFAIHQCACYSSCPRKIHDVAVKQIV